MGRTREFDVEVAVDRALHLFWRKGYEGTSLTDLTEALEINRPSLYAAFGSKEDLFLKALERYTTHYGRDLIGAFEASTAHEVAMRLIRFYADAAGQEDREKGCLIVQGALVCSDDAVRVRAALADSRRLLEETLVKRFERAKREGDLQKDARPADLARFVCTVLFGLAVLGADGATREQLRRVGAMALEAWPA